MASSSSSPPIDTAHHHPLFLPFARFDPLHPEEELPLSVGRPVLVLNREESPDWWFGRDVEDGREGWFPANHGSVESPTTATMHAPDDAAVVIEPPPSPTPVAEEGAAAFSLLDTPATAARGAGAVDSEPEVLPIPPPKADWMLHSPIPSQRPPEQQQPGAVINEPSLKAAQQEQQIGAAAAVDEPSLEVKQEEEQEQERGPAAAVAPSNGGELSAIAKAMQALEAQACPKKRTQTRFSFWGGVSVESSPTRKEEHALLSSPLDKRPSYAERFSCLVGLEGSRNSETSGAGAGNQPNNNKGGVVPSFEGKAPLLCHLLRSERAYVARLAGFKAAFIDVVEKRDTEDRRRLRGMPKLAVALELLVTLGEWNAELLRGLESSLSSGGENEGEEAEEGNGGFDILRLAELFARSAPGLRLYATYAGNHAGALHDLHTCPSALTRSLKAAPLPPTLLSLDGRKPLTVERGLSLPCVRLPQYQQYLAELLTFVSQDDPAFEALKRAYHRVAEETQAANATLLEQAHQLELLRLQQCFLGHVEVFAPQRRLLLEGTVHLVTFNKKGLRVEEQVYMHLFSDALTYSTRYLNGSFLLRHVVNLRECQDLAVFDDTWGYPTECSLITKRHSTRLRVGDVAWVKAIQGQISQCREAELLAQVAKTTPPPALALSASVSSSSFSSSSAALASTMRLDQRGKVLAYMHASEGTYLQYLRTAIRVVIAPLDDLAKGAGLLVGVEEGVGSGSGVSGGEGGRAQGLFESKVSLLTMLTEGRRTKGRIRAQARLLGTPDMLIFLKAYPQIEVVTAELVAALAQRLAQAKHEASTTATANPSLPSSSPSPRERGLFSSSSSSSSSSAVMVADAFLGVIKPLAAAYASYAGAYEEASQTLVTRPEFAALASSPTVQAKLSPLTLARHLLAPFDAMQRYATQLQALIDVTPPDHGDRGPLLEALALVQTTKARMDTTLAEARMFRRIQAIRDSILVLTPPLVGEDPLASLVSSERRLLKEGTLVKACRAKDKAFTFWLFDSCLLYCSPLPASHTYRYQFHRLIPLTECQIRESRTDASALEILSPLKSFALIAASPQMAQEWTAALRTAVAEARKAAGLPLNPTSSSLQTAPLWVQESDAPCCHLCRQAFGSAWVPIGSGQQRYHCRACGQCVCGACSGYRMLLPNMHATRKQRVCGACFKGGKPCLGIEDVSGSGGPRASSFSSSSSSSSAAAATAAVMAAASKPPLPTLTKAKTAGQAPPPKPIKPLRTSQATVGGLGASKASEGERKPHVALQRQGSSSTSTNPFDHDHDDDAASSASSGDDEAVSSSSVQRLLSRPPSLAPARRPPPPSRPTDPEGQAPSPSTRPLMGGGMAAVLAEMKLGGSKLKKAEGGALSSSSSSAASSPPRGARPTHGGMPTGPELLKAIQAATKGLRKVDSPQESMKPPPPPPAGSLLEELTEAMERRRKWLEEEDVEGEEGKPGMVQTVVGGGGAKAAGLVRAVSGAGEAVEEGGHGEEEED